MCTADYVFVLREGEKTEVVHDRHINGLFPRTTWLSLLEETGLRARTFTHRFAGDETSEVFVATWPRSD
jgi:hypothetical protein